MANLITLDDYKTAKKITGFGDDVRLEELVTSVSQLVKTYCNNTIIDNYNSAATELFNIMGGETLVQVSKAPIRTDAGNSPLVYERTSPTETYTTLTLNTDYYIDTVTDSVYRIAGAGLRSWPTGVGAVKVVYKSGYYTTPTDLRLAVIDLVKYYHKDEHTTRRTLTGATIENQGTGESKGFPDHIKRILDLYKTY